MRASGRSRLLQEFSGACGDLGTFVPRAIGAMMVAGLAPAGVLLGFAVSLIATGLFYGLPIPVQPMKAASAAVLIEPMNPGAIAGAGLVIGAFFLLIGMTGIVSRIARALPSTIAAGLQLGLGLSLGTLGIRLMQGQLWLGVAISAGMLMLMRYKRMPVALIAVGCRHRCRPASRVSRRRSRD